jgi:hypothetical protein
METAEVEEMLFERGNTTIVALVGNEHGLPFGTPVNLQSSIAVQQHTTVTVIQNLSISDAHSFPTSSSIYQSFTNAEGHVIFCQYSRWCLVHVLNSNSLFESGHQVFRLLKTQIIKLKVPSQTSCTDVESFRFVYRAFVSEKCIAYCALGAEKLDDLIVTLREKYNELSDLQISGTGSFANQNRTIKFDFGSQNSGSPIRITRCSYDEHLNDQCLIRINESEWTSTVPLMSLYGVHLETANLVSLKKAFPRRNITSAHFSIFFQGAEVQEKEEYKLSFASAQSGPYKVHMGIEMDLNLPNRNCVIGSVSFLTSSIQTYDLLVYIYSPSIVNRVDILCDDLNCGTAVSDGFLYRLSQAKVNKEDYPDNERNIFFYNSRNISQTFMFLELVSERHLYYNCESDLCGGPIKCPPGVFCLAGVARWNAYEKCSRPDACSVGGTDDTWEEELPVNNLESITVGLEGGSQITRNFFRASFDGQYFAVFASETTQIDTWGVRPGQYSLDGKNCDSVPNQYKIKVSGADYSYISEPAKYFCTSIYNADDDKAPLTFPPPVTGEDKNALVVSVAFTQYSYPQPCLQNFYCGYGATSPAGTGKCPRGQFCPSPKSVFDAFDPSLYAYVGRDLPEIQTCSLFKCGQNKMCETHQWYRGEKACFIEMEASPECPMNHLDCAPPLCQNGNDCPIVCPKCIRNASADGCGPKPSDLFSPGVPPQMVRCAHAVGITSGKNYSSSGLGTDTINAPYARRGRASTTEGRSLDQTCTPGTYGPDLGLKKCRRCPPGQKCPNSRMYEGIPCRSGYICQLDVCELYPVRKTVISVADDTRTCQGASFFLPESVIACHKLDKANCDVVLSCEWNNKFERCEQSLLCWTCNPACPQCAPAFSGEQIQCLKGHYCEEGTNTRLPGQGVDPAHTPGYSGEAFSIVAERHRDGFEFKGPLPCPNGTFCLPGVFTKEFNGAKQGEAGWPQLCTPGYYCQPGVGLCRVESENPFTGEKYIQFGCATQKGSGLCPAGTFCPRGSTDPTPAIPGTHVPKAGASAPVDCATGRYSKITGSEECQTCPSGRYNDETRQSQCKTCQKGRFMELSFAMTGKEVRCQDCVQGTYLPLTGSNSSSSCMPTPSGFFCDMFGQTDCFKRVLPSGQISHCKECQEGFLCSAGTSEYLDSMKCPAGFYCGLGTYSGILFGSQPGDQPGSVFFKEVADNCMQETFKSVQFEKEEKVSTIRSVYELSTQKQVRESGVCPKNFYCPRGTLKAQREQSSCPRNHYCPSGSMTGVPCPPGTKSESQKGSIDDCKIDKNWLKSHGERVISINPTTQSSFLLDPYSYSQDSNSRDSSNPANWDNMPILNPLDTTFSYAIQTLQVAHFRFNFSKALAAGLEYDVDYRIALYVDDFPVIDYDTLLAQGPDSRYVPFYQYASGEDRAAKFDYEVLDFDVINPSVFPYKRWTETWDTAMKSLDSDYGGKKERRVFGETCKYDDDCSWCLIGMPVLKIDPLRNECRFDSEMDPLGGIKNNEASTIEKLFNPNRAKSPVGCTMNHEGSCYTNLPYMGKSIRQRKVRTVRQMAWQQSPWDNWRNMKDTFDSNKDNQVSYEELVLIRPDSRYPNQRNRFEQFARGDKMLSNLEFLQLMASPALTEHCQREGACCGGSGGNIYTDRCYDEMSADIRIDTPHDYRLEQTVKSRDLCLEWCKNIKNEHLKTRGKPGVMFTDDGSTFEVPPIGIDIGRPCRVNKLGTTVKTRSCAHDRGPLQGNIVKRYALPQSVRQVITSGGTTKLGLTRDVREQLVSTGITHLTAFARRNSTILIEIEVLNGIYYQNAFNLFSNSMRWVVEQPRVPQLSGDTIYESFIAIYNSGIFTWSLPLNLHNHYVHESEPLSSAPLMYARDYTDESIPNEHKLSQGPHKILFGSLVMKNAASYIADISVEQEMENIVYSAKGSKQSILSASMSPKEWALMKSFQHDNSMRGYDEKMAISTSQFQIGADDPVSRGTTRLPDDIKKTASGFWTSGLSHVTLPFMPYVSNCAGYDSHIPLWKLFQNPEQCIFRQPNETTTTSQFDLLASEKITDYCDVRLHCRYEEDVTTGDASRSYWFEGTEIAFLFFISREPMKNYEFGGWLKAMGTAVNEKKQSEEVNRLVKFENEKLDRYRLYHAVPVTPIKGKVNINEEVIRTGTAAVFQPVDNEGPRSFPKLVHLLVEFWQELEDRKQIAKATIYFSDYRSSASYAAANSILERQRQLEYIFRTTFRHLDYMGLLDNFSLPTPLYIFISFVVGILIVLTFFSIWWALLKSKRFNSVIPHPQMEVSSGLLLIGYPAIKGFGYAFLPTFLIVLIVQMILHKDYLGPLLTDTVEGNVYYFGERSEMVIKTTQQGRMGLSYTLLGVIILIKSANATNPLDSNEREVVKKKNLWRRSQVLLHTIAFIFFQTLMIMVSRT